MFRFQGFQWKVKHCRSLLSYFILEFSWVNPWAEHQTALEISWNSFSLYQALSFLLKSEQIQCWVLHFHLQKGFQCFPDVSLAPNPRICPDTVPELISTNLPVGTQRSTSSLDRFKSCWIFFCLVILLDRHKDYTQIILLLSSCSLTKRIYFPGPRVTSAFSRATVFKPQH